MIVDIVRHTPPWVFVVFVLLIVLGVRRMRATELPSRRLVILPLVMTVLSAFGLWQAFGSAPLPIAAWVAVFLVALSFGWSLKPHERVQYSLATRRIRVPGSVLPLLLMMAIFFLRYGVAVSLAVAPSLRAETVFAATVGALYGLASGVFAARALRTWRSAFGRTGERSFVVSAP